VTSTWRQVVLSLALAPILGGLSLLTDGNPTLRAVPATVHQGDRAPPAATALDARLPDSAPSVSKSSPLTSDDIHGAVIELAVLVETITAPASESDVATATESPDFDPPTQAVPTADQPIADLPSGNEAIAVEVVAPPEPADPTPAEDTPPTAPSETPVAAPPPTPVPATVEAPVAPAPSSRYVTVAELEAALAETPWPAELWSQVVRIAQCESGSDTNRDGYKDIVDTQAQGAGGLYIGVMQVGRDHRFSVAYDLYSLRGNLLAAHELWARAGQSFSPWGCK
jgi:hypothetical protein